MMPSTVSPYFPTFLGDLEFEFRDCSTIDRELVKVSKIKYEPEDEPIMGEMTIQENFVAQKLTLPKLTLDVSELENSVQSCANKQSKPPKHRSISKTRKSTEKPLQQIPDGRISTRESIDSFGGRLTPNFKNRGMDVSDKASPYAVS